MSIIREFVRHNKEFIHKVYPNISNRLKHYSISNQTNRYKKYREESMKIPFSPTGAFAGGFVGAIYGSHRFYREWYGQNGHLYMAKENLIGDIIIWGTTGGLVGLIHPVLIGAMPIVLPPVLLVGVPLAFGTHVMKQYNKRKYSKKNE